MTANNKFTRGPAPHRGTRLRVNLGVRFFGNRKDEFRKLKHEAL